VTDDFVLKAAASSRRVNCAQIVTGTTPIVHGMPKVTRVSGNSVEVESTSPGGATLTFKVIKVGGKWKVAELTTR
jgi:hypothetical protein